jgi:hypothetical protein
MINAGQCFRCKCDIWLPDELCHAARRSDRVEFFCSYGHAQIFCQGETEEQKLRRERDRLAQRIAEKDDEINRQRALREGTERQLSATRGVVTRIKNRVGHGVCACCNRTFGNLARHMATKHPSFSAEAPE